MYNNITSNLYVFPNINRLPPIGKPDDAYVLYQYSEASEIRLPGSETTTNMKLAKLIPGLNYNSLFDQLIQLSREYRLQNIRFYALIANYPQFTQQFQYENIQNKEFFIRDDLPLLIITKVEVDYRLIIINPSIYQNLRINRFIDCTDNPRIAVDHYNIYKYLDNIIQTDIIRPIEDLPNIPVNTNYLQTIGM